MTSFLIEFLKFFFGRIITYRRGKDLERLIDNLEITKKYLGQDNLADTKEYLETKITHKIKILATGYDQREHQDKFFQIYKKCHGHIPELMLKFFMPYTRLENGKLNFELYPFYGETKKLFTISIPVLLLLFIYSYCYLFLAHSILSFLLLAFAIMGCFCYYTNIHKYKEKYKSLITSDND